MEFKKKSSMNRMIKAKDQDFPKTFSPEFVPIRKSSPVRKSRNLLLKYCGQQTTSKSMQIILKSNQHRVEEVKAYLSPVSPQLKSSDIEQPRSGDLSQKLESSLREKKLDFIKIEKISQPLRFELKSSLYERRFRK